MWSHACCLQTMAMIEHLLRKGAGGQQLSLHQHSMGPARLSRVIMPPCCNRLPGQAPGCSASCRIGMMTSIATGAY
jgi:hypothetical protein